SKHLEHVGFKVASIPGNKSQGQRERALKAFRDNEIRVLVATDVAARGIDIPGVTHVFNYDLPEVPDAYIHRIGRTARAGRDGIAIAICATDETGLLRDIERLMGFEIATASGERPEGMSRPVRGGNKRGGQNRGNGNGQGRGRGGEGRPERRERPARNPFFQSEGSDERGGRPQREARRNDDFRGQRRGEEAPRSQADNDLASTSDFGVKKQFGGPQGEGRPTRKEQHRKGNAPAAHGAHEAGNQRSRSGHGRPANKGSGNGGPVKFGGDSNRGGNQGRKRRPA